MSELEAKLIEQNNKTDLKQQLSSEDIQKSRRHFQTSFEVA
jgi:hypothetical protein